MFVSLFLSKPDKLATWAANAVKALGQATDVHVGFLENSTAGWNGPRPAKPGARKRTVKPPSSIPAVSAAYVAAILEYGNPKNGMPPRPFFSNMVAAKSPGWSKLLAIALEQNNYYSRPALTMVGVKIKEQLQQAILDFTEPGILQSTKDRKGFDQPLIDSHNMINSVDFAVL